MRFLRGRRFTNANGTEARSFTLVRIGRYRFMPALLWHRRLRRARREHSAASARWPMTRVIEVERELLDPTIALLREQFSPAEGRLFGAGNVSADGRVKLIASDGIDLAAVVAQARAMRRP